MKTEPILRECSTEEINTAVSALWPKMATAREVDPLDPCPIIDGHFGVGFSVRLFTSKTTPHPGADNKAAYAALDDMLSAMEDMGFAVTRNGNQWQAGRLVLGWRTSAA